MIFLTIKEQKEEINKIILPGIKEILHKGMRVSDKTLGGLEDDLGMLMKALQVKNKIYDYAVMCNYNSLLRYYEGKIIYSLVNTEKMGNDASEYEEILEFRF